MNKYTKANKAVNTAFKLEILRDLDVEAFDQWMLETVGEQPSCREVSLAAMHKARYQLATMGRLERCYLVESRRWLVAHGMTLPEMKLPVYNHGKPC